MWVNELLAWTVVLLWLVDGAVAVIRRRAHHELRSVEAHRQALQSLAAMRDRPPLASFEALAHEPDPIEAEEPQVILLDGDRLPDPLPVAFHPPTRRATGETPRVRASAPPDTLAEPDTPAEHHTPAPVRAPPTAEVTHVPVVLPAVPPAVPAAAVPPAVPAWTTRRSMWRTTRRRVGPRSVWAVAAAALLAVVVGATVMAMAGGHAAPRRADRVTSVVPRRPAVVPKAPATPPPPAVQYPVQVTAAGVQAVVDAGATVEFGATAPCWLRVTSQGSTVFEGTLQPGISQSVVAHGPLSARVGNAAAARIDVDGQPTVLPDVGPNPLDITVTTRTTT